MSQDLQASRFQEPGGPEGAISVCGLSFRYRASGQAVLGNLSLEIPAGAITAILGPNGSGKTTLLRLLLGLLHPQQGEILIAGRAQGSCTRRELSRLIGLVPQEEHIPFDFSMLDYVLMGRAPYLGPLEMPGETDFQAARAALDAAGLSHLRDRSLPTLSGGERQLATVARALAQRPRILLLDEPAAHLDLSNQSRLLAIMRVLASEGVTQVFTTHDPNLAASAAGFAALMRHGQILAAGPAEAVLTSEVLSTTYGVPVQVYEVDGRKVILLPCGQGATGASGLSPAGGPWMSAS